MSTQKITRCDVCGIEKGETNHWWKYSNGYNRFNVSVADTCYDYHADACSAACITKAFSQFLGRQRFEAS